MCLKQETLLTVLDHGFAVVVNSLDAVPWYLRLEVFTVTEESTLMAAEAAANGKFRVFYDPWDLLDPAVRDKLVGLFL